MQEIFKLCKTNKYIEHPLIFQFIYLQILLWIVTQNYLLSNSRVALIFLGSDWLSGAKESSKCLIIKVNYEASNKRYILSNTIIKSNNMLVNFPVRINQKQLQRSSVFRLFCSFWEACSRSVVHRS